MAVHLLRDLEVLKSSLFELGALVEEAVNDSIVTLIDRQPSDADRIIADDRIIDDIEVRLEEECLKLLALHHPVAADLRFIVTVLKVTNDLERIGDLAVNIAARAQDLGKLGFLDLSVDLRRMGDVVRSMIHDGLQSLLRLDLDLATQVLENDEIVDRLHRQMFDVSIRQMREDPESAPRLMQYLSASRYMERIADHATNIVEDVIFMVKGEVVRHQELDA